MPNIEINLEARNTGVDGKQVDATIVMILYVGTCADVLMYVKERKHTERKSNKSKALISN